MGRRPSYSFGRRVAKSYKFSVNFNLTTLLLKALNILSTGVDTYYCCHMLDSESNRPPHLINTMRLVQPVTNRF